MKTIYFLLLILMLATGCSTAPRKVVGYDRNYNPVYETTCMPVKPSAGYKSAVVCK